MLWWLFVGGGTTPTPPQGLEKTVVDLLPLLYSSFLESVLYVWMDEISLGPTCSFTHGEVEAGRSAVAELGLESLLVAPCWGLFASTVESPCSGGAGPAGGTVAGCGLAENRL